MVVRQIDNIDIMRGHLREFRHELDGKIIHWEKWKYFEEANAAKEIAHLFDQMIKRMAEEVGWLPNEQVPSVSA